MIIYTNGTRLLESEADTIFVSVDGLQSTVFFYFHTPYYGYDELYLDTVKKNENMIPGRKR